MEKKNQYGSLIFITPCLLHYVCHTMFDIQCLSCNVCHTMFVTQCLSHNICHTVFVTQYLSHNVSHTLSHNVGYPTLDYSVCDTLFNTDCMTNMTNPTSSLSLAALASASTFCFSASAWCLFLLLFLECTELAALLVVSRTLKENWPKSVE